MKQGVLTNGRVQLLMSPGDQVRGMQALSCGSRARGQILWKAAEHAAGRLD
jgi:hypothetical protein